MATQTQTTPEGTEYKPTGSRIIFPTPDHEYGGGVTLTEDSAADIRHHPDDGEHVEEQLEWHHTGETIETRAGPSKELEITQTSFGRERTVAVSLVDVADAELDGLLDYNREADR